MAKIVVATFNENEDVIFDRVISTLNQYTQLDSISSSTSILAFETGLEIYPQQHKIIYAGDELTLSKHEYEVLYLLAQHPGWIFSKEQIYELIWHEHSNSCFSAVTNTISRLRKKITPYSKQSMCIQTVPGHGYKFILQPVNNE